MSQTLLTTNTKWAAIRTRYYQRLLMARSSKEYHLYLYYYIKENLLSLMSGCLRTPPKLKGLGQWNSDTVFTNVWGVTWVGSFWGSTLRAALRLRKVLENAILRPWHPEFWSCNHEFWVLCSSYWPYEKTLLVLFDTTLRASFRLMEVLENAVLRPWHPEFWSCKNEFWVFCSTYWPYEKNIIGSFWYHPQG